MCCLVIFGGQFVIHRGERRDQLRGARGGVWRTTLHLGGCRGSPHGQHSVRLLHLFRPRNACCASWRCLHFSPCGAFLATGGDDKQLKLWSTKDWSCYRSQELAKKATAVCVSQDSATVVASDKFGEVVTLATSPAAEGATAKFLLGHMSLVTSMVLVEGDQYVVTADRDEHVRVSHFPDAYDIHTVLLGHKVFVTAVAASTGRKGLVVSGDGKGEIRVWRYTDSVEVACTQVTAVDGVSEAVILSMGLSHNLSLIHI